MARKRRAAYDRDLILHGCPEGFRWDPSSETQLMRRLNALVSKKQAAQAPGANYSRGEAMVRDAKQAACRKATLDRRQQLEAQRIKFQEETFDLAKAKEERILNKGQLRERERENTNWMQQRRQPK